MDNTDHTLQRSTIRIKLLSMHTVLFVLNFNSTHSALPTFSMYTECSVKMVQKMSLQNRKVSPLKPNGQVNVCLMASFLRQPE